MVAKIIDQFNCMNKLLNFLYQKLIDISLFAYQFYIPEGTLSYHENVRLILKENVIENDYSVENLALSGEP